MMELKTPSKPTPDGPISTATNFIRTKAIRILISEAPPITEENFKTLLYEVNDTID
jgi:hypothetical protein